MSASHDDQNGYRVPFYRYGYCYYIMFLHKNKDGILPVHISGKIPFSFEGIDTVSLAAHKIYGLNGSGILFKRKELIIIDKKIVQSEAKNFFKDVESFGNYFKHKLINFFEL